jgi:hypothetical protein
MDREVVITGLGVVSPIGVGRDEVWDAVVARRSGVRPLPHLATAGWLAPFGGEVSGFDPKELIQPRKSIKIMSREIQLACAAAELAWQDAGLSDASIDPDRFGVINAAGLLYCELEELRVPFIEWTKQRISTSIAGRAKRWAKCTHCGCSNTCPTCRPVISASDTMRAGRTTRLPKAMCRRSFRWPKRPM